jgi:hypothetical protein
LAPRAAFALAEPVVGLRDLARRGYAGLEDEEGLMSTYRSLLGAIALSAVALAATPAFAFHCPQEMAKIDKALAANPKLSESDLAKVKQLRAQGEELHEAGQHQESLDTLAQAEKMLGI